jgi:hypothetical protein
LKNQTFSQLQYGSILLDLELLGVTDHDNYVTPYFSFIIISNLFNHLIVSILWMIFPPYITLIFTICWYIMNISEASAIIQQQSLAFELLQEKLSTLEIAIPILGNRYLGPPGETLTGANSKP